MSLDTYVKGTQCWFIDDKEGWISATLSTKDVAADGKVTLTFVDEHGKVCFSSFSSLFWALLLSASLSLFRCCVQNSKRNENKTSNHIITRLCYNEIRVGSFHRPR